jgi:hypothetical protein
MEIIAVIVILISTAMDPLELQDSVGARALSCGPDGGLSISGYIGPVLCPSSFSSFSEAPVATVVPKLKIYTHVRLCLRYYLIVRRGSRIKN